MSSTSAWATRVRAQKATRQGVEPQIVQTLELLNTMNDTQGAAIIGLLATLKELVGVERESAEKLLRTTKAGKAVNYLGKNSSNQSIKAAATDLVHHWKLLVGHKQPPPPSTPPPVIEAAAAVQQQQQLASKETRTHKTKRQVESESEGESESESDDVSPHWVQCTVCLKWRRVPMHVTKAIDEGTVLKWMCSMNPDPERNSCSIRQERMVEGETFEQKKEISTDESSGEEESDVDGEEVDEEEALRPLTEEELFQQAIAQGSEQGVAERELQASAGGIENDSSDSSSRSSASYYDSSESDGEENSYSEDEDSNEEESEQKDSQDDASEQDECEEKAALLSRDAEKDEGSARRGEASTLAGVESPHETAAITAKQQQLEAVNNLQLMAVATADIEDAEDHFPTGNVVMSVKTLQCPITCSVLVDPVIAADGHTYEREAITQWFSRNSLQDLLSPMTGLPMKNKELTDNFAIKQQLAAAREASSALPSTSIINSSRCITHSAEPRHSVSSDTSKIPSDKRRDSSTLDDICSNPDVGDRVKVFFTVEERWFAGEVVAKRVDHDGKTLIHQIKYDPVDHLDNGEVRWHNLEQERVIMVRRRRKRKRD